MKKVSIANIIISIIIVIIAGVLFYNNRYNISNDMDNTEMYVMLRNTLDLHPRTTDKIERINL